MVPLEFAPVRFPTLHDGMMACLPNHLLEAFLHTHN